MEGLLLPASHPHQHRKQTLCIGVTPRRPGLREQGGKAVQGSRQGPRGAILEKRKRQDMQCSLNYSGSANITTTGESHIPLANTEWSVLISSRNS